MPTFKMEDIICWGDDQDKVLCSDCFKKEFPDYPSEWEPILFTNAILAKQDSLVKSSIAGRLLKK